MQLNVSSLLDNMGLSPIRRMSREFSQDFVPVEAIKDGTIVIKHQGEDRFIRIMEIIPPVFEFRTPEEQHKLLSRYRSMLKNAPSSFQIKVSTQFSDVERYIEAAQAACDEETDPACKERILDYMSFLKNEAAYASAAEKRYYFIFQYEGDSLGILSKRTNEEILIELDRTYDRLSEGFRSMGCKVVEHKSPTRDISKLLYRFYNQEITQKEDFQDRVQRIRHDAALVNNGVVSDEVDFKDYLAPKTLDLMESDHITVDGKYRAYFYVDGRKYPDEMNVYGWLYGLTSFGIGCDVDIFYNKKDTAQLLTLLRQRIKFSGLKLTERDEASIDTNEILDNYYGVKYLIDAIQREKQAIYDMAVLVTVHARSLEDLELRKRELLLYAKENDISLVDCKRLQEDAFLSSGFFNTPAPKLFNRAKHIVTTDAVVAAYPFLSFKVEDPTGVYLGTVKRTESLMMYDIFNGQNRNFNLFLLGSPGAGKTYTLLTLLARLRYHGVQCFVITPDKQHEFVRFCKSVGGLFIDLSSASKDRINVFDIWPMSSEVRKVLYGDMEVSWKVEKVQSLKKWLKFLLKHAGPAELAELESIIVSLYTDFGITEDNNSIYTDSSKTKLKEMPIISDFYERVLESNAVSRDTKSILRTFIDGAAKSMNGHTNIDLNNKFIVFGLENLKKADDLVAPTMYITLEYVWNQVKRDITKKKMIAIDEGWELIDGSDEDVANNVKLIFKMIRGLGGGAAFATQSIHDLLDSARGSGAAIINSCYTRILLGMQSDDLKYTTSAMDLTSSEREMIAEFDRGEALFCSGDMHVPIRIKASPKEDVLFTTRRDRLEELAQNT